MANVKKNRSHRSKDINDHIVDKTKFLEMGAQDAPVSNINWDVQQGEVHADPIEDGGHGTKMIVRRFFFKLPPMPEGTVINNDEILDYHVKHTITPLLWRDELQVIDKPRIIAGKRGSYTIVAICEPRLMGGVFSTIHERPELVQDIISKT